MWNLQTRSAWVMIQDFVIPRRRGKIGDERAMGRIVLRTGTNQRETMGELCTGNSMVR